MIYMSLLFDKFNSITINTVLSLDRNRKISTEEAQIVCSSHSRHGHIKLDMSKHVYQMDIHAINGSALGFVDS